MFIRAVFRIVSILLVVAPAAVAAQTRDGRLDPSAVVGNTENENNGINPEYSLPKTPTLESPLASLPDASSPIPVPSSQISGQDREVSWHKLPMNILYDRKDMWLFPLELGRGRHWLAALFITGGTAAFIASDPQVMPHFRQTTDFRGFNRVFSTTATGAVIAAVPALFGSQGFV